MTSWPIHLGDALLREGGGPVEGGFEERDGVRYARIARYDRLAPFFMSVVSAADHWMFVSSHGALTAGRRDADSALFPYTTEDRIHDGFGRTGSRTVLLLERAGRTSLWEPFSPAHEGVYELERNLYKSVAGDRLVFEEVNRSLGATFSYAWSSSERFGFVRRATLANHGDEAAHVRVLDGLIDLLPSGVESGMQAGLSNLVDAYKLNELLPDVGLALFRLSSIPIDRAEPSEALRATTVWCDGLSGAQKLLGTRQVAAFRRGEDVEQETLVRGARGAFLVQAELDLAPGAEERWSIVAEVDQGAKCVTRLVELLGEPGRKEALLEEDVRRGTAELVGLVARADGLQSTSSPLEDARHFANTLFNVMRGGVFVDGYALRGADLADFVRELAPEVAARHAERLGALPARLELGEARRLARESGDPDLERVAREYLPLAFSRRHGDPSRPWNRFSIATRDADGVPRLRYEGNWRDIFQNWEALCASFPAFAESVVSKFLNASTADGYNPYRVTREGFEWEEPDPSDPWAYIGYWGDHQVVYLTRLVELWERHEPGALGALLDEELFVYADVPYRMRPYTELLADPRHTIDYDVERAAAIAQRVAREGAEGKLVRGADGEVVRVTLAEKLLVPLLVKLSNFVPEAGIWMNTQRPEWNDANNALVGHGVSVVTLCHLARALELCAALFAAREGALHVSAEVAGLLRAIERTFDENAALLERSLSNAERRVLLDELGRAGSEHRGTLYERGFDGAREALDPRELARFLRLALRWVQHSIRANRRDDGLWHAYNLMELEPGGGVAIRRLDVMLEGQVAVLSSGCLDARESQEVLAALRESALWRADQRSYLLYPDRSLPGFLEKNTIPSDAARRSRLLATLVDAGDERLVVRDSRGGLHFSAELRNADVLARVLDEMRQGPYASLVEAERELLLELYESVFDHRSFTGRSGTFFGYEGLGCIYWHQVSKLLVAVQETFQRAVLGGEPDALVRRLAERYHDVRAGLGTHHTPESYGAFPTDPYSHTPADGGARQPGLTGQVKEDFLARMGELGVWVTDGRVTFRPLLLRAAEKRAAAATFEYQDALGEPRSLAVERGSLAFTYCQVPIVLHAEETPRVRITRSGGSVEERPGRELDRETSVALFGRTGEVQRIDIFADEAFDTD